MLTTLHLVSKEQNMRNQTECSCFYSLEVKLDIQSSKIPNALDKVSFPLFEHKNEKVPTSTILSLP